MGVQEERSRVLILGLEELVGRFCATVSSQGDYRLSLGLLLTHPYSLGNQ